MLWDTHMHTQFSGDSTAPVEAMIESAIANRLDGICFTDHMDYDYPNEPDLFVFDIEKYTEFINECGYRGSLCSSYYRIVTYQLWAYTGQII